MSKVVLITGCSSGIGQATAHFFADEDWEVVATMRHPEQRETGLRDIENVELVHLDVLDPQSIKDAVSHTLEKHGHIDVLVNNAGYAVEGPFEAATPEQAARQFETNVLGLMAVTREVLPRMREQRSGIIVNLSAPRLTVIAATVTQGKYLLCVISAQEPYLFPERHRNLEVSKKCPRTGTRFMMVRHSLSPINGNTLSIRK